MRIAKFVGAFLGWFIGGTIGCITGFLLGSLIDGISYADGKLYEKEQRNKKKSSKVSEFEISLLILSALVIKANGNIDQRELDFVRDHFTKIFGKESANKAFETFNTILANDTVSAQRVCFQIKKNIDHPSRLQILYYLFGIASSDGYISPNQTTEIRKMAAYLFINRQDFESIQAMFASYTKRSEQYRQQQPNEVPIVETDNAYKILKLDNTASDKELKKAYRKMAKKYHPDKIQHLGESHRKVAEEKFKQIKNAYEYLQAARGF